MRKYFYIFTVIFLSIILSPLSAHTPLMMIEDNEDGTLTVEGGFSTSAGAAGVNFYVKTKLEGKVLVQQKFPETSIIEVKIPQEPYYLVFDGGPGHKVVKDGPPPPEGFTVNIEASSMQPEKSDMTGIPIPVPVLIIILISAVLSVFIVPKLLKQKKTNP